MIPLAVPDLTGNEKKYLNDCIDTTYVSSVGAYVNRLEEMVGEATGSRLAVCTSSGTTGLHAALTAVGVGHGDLVILPTFTFIASANAIRHCGAKPWLFDIDPSTWCIDVSQVERSLQEECTISIDLNGKKTVTHSATGQRVAAIMPVYTLGNLPDMSKLHELAGQYGLPLIADAACAIGANYWDEAANESKRLGRLADLSVFSFNGNKTITCGGGGAVVGANERQLAHVKHLTTTARVWPDYDFDEVGFNYRMTNIQAAVGVAQMERLDRFVGRKREIRRWYKDSLSSYSDSAGVSLFPDTRGCSCWFSGIVLGKGQGFKQAKDVCERLKERGIEAKPFWKPVHLQAPYADCPVAKKEGGTSTDVADGLWDRIVTLPCSTNITDGELEAVSDAVREILLGQSRG